MLALVEVVRTSITGHSLFHYSLSMTDPCLTEDLLSFIYRIYIQGHICTFQVIVDDHSKFAETSYLWDLATSQNTMLELWKLLAAQELLYQIMVCNCFNRISKFPDNDWYILHIFGSLPPSKQIEKQSALICLSIETLLQASKYDKCGAQK